MTMKIFFRTEKYVFDMAGLGSICADGFRIPYHAYKRVIPFCYSYLGTCWLAHWDKPEDIMEWIEYQESERKRKK